MTWNNLCWAVWKCWYGGEV